jgi:hypothetical protein
MRSRARRAREASTAHPGLRDDGRRALDALHAVVRAVRAVDHTLVDSRRVLASIAVRPDEDHVARLSGVTDALRHASERLETAADALRDSAASPCAAIVPRIMDAERAAMYEDVARRRPTR